MIYLKFVKEKKKIINPLFDTDKIAYYKAIDNLKERFKLALFKKHHVENNPKSERVWEIAWKKGFIYGYGEVEGYFDELVELIK